MIEHVNPILQIEHITMKEIISLYANQHNKAIITYGSSFQIPFAKATATLTKNTTKSNPGTTFTFNLSLNLKSELPRLNLGILLIEFESGEKIIIGDLQLPVKDISAPESLLQKVMQISHKSWHEPYRIAF